MILLRKNKVFREISVFQRSQKDQEKTMIKPLKNGPRAMKNQDKKRGAFPTPLFRILVSILKDLASKMGAKITILAPKIII